MHTTARHILSSFLSCVVNTSNALKQEALKVDAECVNIHSQGWKGPYMVTVQLTRTSAAGLLRPPISSDLHVIQSRNTDI